MTRLVAIDTSTSCASVALFEDEHLALAQVWRSVSSHTQTLLPVLERAQQQLGWSPESVDVVGVAIGPGAFSGIRVGLATAKAFSWARQIPLLAIGSLAARAMIFHGSGRILSAIPAGRGEWYVALFDRCSGELRTIEGPSIAGEQTLLALVSSNPACILEIDRWPRTWPILGGAFITGSHSGYAAAVGVGKLALIRYQCGERDEPALLQAHYLRQSAAEERRSNQGGGR
ncbi:MAG: tRNA (adenosine(37)-N6)-threonylcarbamoyltransferase complex dimerization subunit type 1 TsaB [Chloroflexi bacterium]|nr:tRNA (adenosine(37)-N6)-threonylcarbamoyltransferase complex dimerization subunit type 1 TsaB [Chloroflexota bacterium]